MRVLLSPLLVLVLGCATTPDAAAPPPVEVAAPAAPAKIAAVKGQIDEATVDAVVSRALKTWEVPGLAVVVVKDGKVLVSKGYGVRKLGEPDPVDADTLFAIASISKTFAATGVAALVDEGKLAWDDPVVKHLPQFAVKDPAITPQVTVRDLLSHRVGLPTFGGDVVWFLSTRDRRSVFESIRHVPLVFPFRSGFGYSNLMFMTAGELFPATSGRSWEDFTRERILQPLGMQRTAMTLEEALTRGNLATAHSNIDHRGLRPLPNRNVDVIGAAATMYSSANDLARWLLLHADRGVLDGKRIISEPRQEELWTMHNAQPVPPRVRRLAPMNFNGYGLGWQLRDYDGHFMARHGGALSGMFSYLLVLPDQRLGIAVMTNADTQGLYSAVALELLDTALRRVGPDWVQETRKLEVPFVAPAPGKAVEAKAFSRFEGNYRSEHYGKATLERRDGKLVLRPQAHPGLECELTQITEDVLRCPWSLVEFGTSDLAFSTKKGRRSFEVKFHPEFIDTLTYTFERQ